MFFVLFSVSSSVFKVSCAMVQTSCYIIILLYCWNVTRFGVRSTQLSTVCDGCHLHFYGFELQSSSEGSGLSLVLLAISLILYLYGYEVDCLKTRVVVVNMLCYRSRSVQYYCLCLVYLCSLYEISVITSSLVLSAGLLRH